MSRPPAVVIVARHGARLDAADKQWHLTSPTPYDPPLTYGGWTQSRALGARIASLLQARESSLQDYSRNNPTSSTTSDAESSDIQEAGAQKNGRPRRRKHRVILHTSPFLRCVQTSVAISAGMAQLHSPDEYSSHSTPQSNHPHSGSPHLHAVDSMNTSTLSAIPEPEEDLTQQVHKKHRRRRRYRKAIVRVDAFLGEWLSPDYFDLITPPPSSVMMVASAKADLLRRAEYVDPSHETTNGKANQGNFPGGWGSNWGGSSFNTDCADEGPLSSISSAGHGLPRKDRSSSHSSSKYSRSGISKIVSRVKEQGGYTPPTPTYAISPSDPIPPGYVAHARDACVEVDYQWDSMREPQQWGDGGEYGEEWSAMHKRFRKGLQSMISCYRSHGSSKNPYDTQDAVPGVRDEDEDEDNDGNDDLVLILVTHGAGCNALIGALTNQPVLLDVGMASLTMAVRKDILNGVNSSSTPAYQEPTFSPRRKSSINIGVSEDYEVKLVASTEHLRSGSNSNGIPHLQSSSSKTSVPQISTYRHRYGPIALAGGPTDGNFTIGEPAARSMTSVGYGGQHRSSSAASSAPRSFPNTARNGSLGLWAGSPTLSTSEEETGLGDDMVLNFGDGAHDGKEVPTEAESRTLQDTHKNGKDNVTPPLWSGGNMGRSNSQRGLWGAAPLGIANERERGPKRRWTVNEKHSG
ncbi:MAG: hypothetical protein M1836_005504 [Candelina mexicana]|nr:MAG: hypothetical protein M1836_005504 [Candelina mexicana]